MTPNEAAAVIGCTGNQVRHLIRKGRLRSKRIRNRTYGYHYEVSRREAERYRDAPQTKGFPRGAKRTKLRGPVQDDQS